MTDNIVPEKPQTEKQGDAIAKVTAWLVGLLAFGAFLLSYDALRSIAIQAGIDGWKSLIWPLLIDFALIVFSLSVVRSERLKENVSRGWLLVGFFTAATIIFNVLHSVEIDENAQHWLSPIMAAIAPIAFVLAFETLMSQLRQHVKRQGVIKNIADLTAIAERLQGKVKKLALELGETTKRVKTQQTAVSILNDEIARLDAAKLALTTKINELKTEAATVYQDHQKAVKLIDGIEAKRDEAAKLEAYLKKLQADIIKTEKQLNEMDQADTFSDYHLKVAHLLGQNPQITGREVGEALGGKSTTWGNKLKNEIAPVLNGGLTNGNGSK